jgi:hypothetical protein
MNIDKTLFAQLMDFLPCRSFHRIVDRRDGDRYVKSVTCADQFRAMAFAQLTYRESLRDIEFYLSTQAVKLYHTGFRHKIKQSTLADANAARDWRIHAEFAQCRIVQARKLCAGGSFGIELEITAYALDSTTIDLCLSLFPWALFRTTKSAVKMHTLLGSRGNIASFIHLSDGKLEDVKALDFLALEAAEIYGMDRGYLDFTRLYTLHQAQTFFVTRAKSNTRFQHVYSAMMDRSTGIICGQTAALIGTSSCGDYPEHLHRIRFKDSENGKTLVFLTNNFAFPPATICALYKARWQVELFFKRIKHHLRVKQLYGNSENAVRSLIWIAASVSVLVAIVRKLLHLDASLHTLLQIFSHTLFEKMPIQQAFPGSDYKMTGGMQCNQLNQFPF